MKSYSKLALVALMFCFVGCDNSSDKLAVNRPEPVVVDKVRDIATPRIDILFVVDDSGSMNTHQRNLAANIDLFINEIKNFGFLDYRIGVVTSSISPWGGPDEAGINGNLIGVPNYVDRNTRDGENLLRKRILVGTDGSATEVFLETAALAFSADKMSKTNSGFYRNNAYLAIFFITDAEDQGQVKPLDLYNSLVSLKLNQPSKILSYGAIVPTNSATRCERDDGSTPKRIEEFIALTDGLYFDLCDTQFGVKLAGVAKDLAGRVARVIHLSRRPKLETVKVVYGTQEIPHDPRKGWIYSARTNSLLLGEDIEFTIQPDGTDLDVTFEPAE